MSKTKQAPPMRAPRDYRIAAGFSEAMVAAYPDKKRRVDLKTLGKVERGEDVTARTLDKLALLFKVAPAEFAAAYYAVRLVRGAAL